MDQFLGLINTAIYFYSWLLIIYIFMSWFPGARESSFGEVIGKLCEPYLEIFRRFIPPVGMIDFSPIVAIIVLRFAGYGLDAFFRMIF